MPTITWTFDPLVARNGHFNLDKLGAVGAHYERSFYGTMGDVINGNDESDRLVAVWSTTAPTPSRTESPSRDHSASLLAGPDGLPAYLTRHRDALVAATPDGREEGGDGAQVGHLVDLRDDQAAELSAAAWRARAARSACRGRRRRAA